MSANGPITVNAGEFDASPVTVARVRSVHAEAMHAALRWQTLDEACPYPWRTPDATLFRIFFVSARALLGHPSAATTHPTQSPTP